MLSAPASYYPPAVLPAGRVICKGWGGYIAQKGSKILIVLANHTQIHFVKETEKQTTYDPYFLS